MPVNTSINSIKLTASGEQSSVIRTKCDWFKKGERFVIKSNSTKIVIHKVQPSYEGKTVKGFMAIHSVFSLFFLSDLPIGEYDITKITDDYMIINVQ